MGWIIVALGTGLVIGWGTCSFLTIGKIEDLRSDKLYWKNRVARITALLQIGKIDEIKEMLGVK